MLPGRAARGRGSEYHLKPYAIWYFEYIFYYIFFSLVYVERNVVSRSHPLRPYERRAQNTYVQTDHDYGQGTRVQHIKTIYGALASLR